MTHEIEVTEDDIARGKRCDARSCPIALAIRRAVGREYGVLVAYSNIYLGLDEQAVPDWRMTPPAIERWLLDYDNGLAVQPFSFDLGSLVAMTPGEAPALAEGENECEINE